MLRKTLLFLPAVLIALLEEVAVYWSRKGRYGIASKLSRFRLKLGLTYAESELAAARIFLKAAQYDYCLHSCARAQKKIFKTENDSKQYLTAYSIFLVWSCAAKDEDNVNLDLKVCKKAFFDAFKDINFTLTPDHIKSRFPFPKEFFDKTSIWGQYLGTVHN